jgi:hypothetical protein
LWQQFTVVLGNGYLSTFPKRGDAVLEKQPAWRCDKAVLLITGVVWVVLVLLLEEDPEPGIGKWKDTWYAVDVGSVGLPEELELDDDDDQGGGKWNGTVNVIGLQLSSHLTLATVNEGRQQSTFVGKSNFSRNSGMGSMLDQF